jgi:predicted TIM-barrel fold metal-dependent hydrolase
LHKDRIKEAVETVGDDRILYGSDMTLLNPSITVGMVEEADISQSSKENIFHGNAERILRL